MPPRASDPPTAYLRFKHGFTTTLLLTTPLTPFSAIIADLLEALQSRYPAGLPSSSTSFTPPLPIPSSITAVRLAALIDPYEPAKGWRELDWNTSDRLRNHPKGAGVQSGAVVAFAFRDLAGEEEVERMADGRRAKVGEEGAEDFWVEWPEYDDDFEEEEGEGLEGDGQEEDMSDGL